MTASSEPGYYERHPEAREKRLELEHAISAFNSIIGVSNIPTEFASMLDLNTRSTKDCVDFIRKAGLKTHYVYRGCDLKDKHPFTDETTAFRILAPEEDTSVYYERIPHLALGSKVPDATMADDSVRLLPLPGVDGGIFYELMYSMDNTFFGAVFAIDRAQNNTSVVFELSWRNRRLLFTGDAELKSWYKIAENNSLQPVDLFKIGHHGSRTALPPAPILDQILVPDRRSQAFAVLTSCEGVYPGVPDPQSLATIKERAKNIYSTADVAAGTPLILTLGAKKKK